MARPLVRTLVLSALACLVTSGPAPGRTKSHTVHKIPGPDPCTRPDDRAAFDIISLKSELTVTALACHEQARYNIFMRAYQPAIVSADTTLSSYFKRVYGRKAATVHDEYITNLASAQEQEGLKSGTAYCAAFDQMFDEVMSLQNAAELADYEHSQAIAEPVSFAKCSTQPVAAPMHVRRHVVKKKSA